MNRDDHLLIFGASGRAAAFSALRAGLRPWCADLFADLDLRARCPALAIPTARYPHGFLDALRMAPPGPILYTGALENYPWLIRKLAAARPLVGNDAATLAVVRAPEKLRRLLTAAGLPCPRVSTSAARLPQSGRWLVKPRRGAGGVGIRFHEREAASQRGRGLYYQEWIEGEPCAALYKGDGQTAQLLGVTQQLVGEPWLHTPAFRYGGSIGPLPVAASTRAALVRLGSALVEGAGLRGLFGVDFLLREGVPWPVEVNPRYTASVEVLEYATGLTALHEGALPSPAAAAAACVGKAILFAPANLIVPAVGPWMTELALPRPVGDLPDYADIPPPGQPIPAGRPILTFFARGDTVAACGANLQRLAERLTAAVIVREK